LILLSYLVRASTMYSIIGSANIAILVGPIVAGREVKKNSVLSHHPHVQLHAVSKPRCSRPINAEAPNIFYSRNQVQN
jgi:hypothetical protein